MSRLANRNIRAARTGNGTKYDANATVLSKTYGALADLRRELADSKARVSERSEVLQMFSACNDSQRLWLLLEDYFEKLSLSRKDFAGETWWTRIMAAQGKSRLEELAMLFHRANRPIPTELLPHANVGRFAELAQAEQEQKLLQKLENWMFPPAPVHLDSPRASLRVVCDVQPSPEHPALHSLVARLNLFRPRSGEKFRPFSEVIELTSRAAHEQELFSAEDWAFITWLAETYPEGDSAEAVRLGGLDLLLWLARWGNTNRLHWKGQALSFQGDVPNPHAPPR